MTTAGTAEDTGLCLDRLFGEFQTLLDPRDLRYNPRGDVIFPGIVEVGGRIPKALAVCRTCAFGAASNKLLNGYDSV